MLPESLFLPILLIILGILGPQAWREDSTFIEAIFKFWLFVLPLFLGSLGILMVFTGPILALYGLFNTEFIGFTIFYVYFTFLVLLQCKYPKLINI